VKAKWNKPELTILYRGRPEEHLEDSCKSVSGGTGADHRDNKCDEKKNDQGGICGACHPEPPSGGS